MKYLQFFFGLLRLAFIALAIGIFLPALPYAPFVVFAVLIVASCFMRREEGVAYGIILETWANYIVERFWKDNPFLKYAKDDSEYVVQGRIVHIPQIGGKPSVVKNRSSFPATASRRTDTELLYSLEHYSTDPVHIPNIDKVHLSFSKQDSVLGDIMSVLTELVADDMLLKWAANASFANATGRTRNADGTTTVTTQAAVTGQTGTRKAFTEMDLADLMIAWNVANVPKADRYIMFDDYMFGGFYASLSGTNAKDFSRFMDATNGVIGKLHGFNIMTRSSLFSATSANAPKALGAAIGTTDNICSLAWQKDSVAFAMGDKHLFQNTNDALYYGDVHSCEMWAGGRVRRADALGVTVIAQAA